LFYIELNGSLQFERVNHLAVSFDPPVIKIRYETQFVFLSVTSICKPDTFSPHVLKFWE